MANPAKYAADEAEIAALLEAYAAALGSKDARAVVAFYAWDVVAYDLAPPLQIEAPTVRDPEYLQEWFDTWDGPIQSQTDGLEIVVGEDVAYAFGLRHLLGTKVGGERVDLWFRATACLQRADGAWKIAHVHNSVPFAMDGSDRALLDLKP
jgi:ketosteroid isomerase-like protein